MHTYYRRFISQGIFPDTPAGLGKLIRLGNFMIVMIALTYWGNSLLFFVEGNFGVPAMGLIFGGLQFTFLIFTHQRRYEYAWLGLMILNGFVIFSFSTLFEREIGLFWYYSLILLTTYVFFFEPEYQVYRWISLACLALWLWLDLGLSVHPYGIRPVGTEIAGLAKYTIPAFCFALMMSYINYFMRGTHHYEAKLARKNESLKAQNQQLEKVNQELDQFLYYASHDLRAPVASTQGLITLAREAGSLEEVQQYLNLQERSLSKLDSLIRDILNYSRNKRAEIDRVEIDFESLVQEAFESQQSQRVPAAARLDFHIEQTDPFFSDPARLQVILNNLVVNALQYHNPEVTEPWIEVGIKTCGASASIEIKDNGQGIRPDQLDKIFQMFFRGTNKSEGTGLGLYIVKETLQTLGGEVTVDSMLGEGTTFHLELPNVSPVANSPELYSVS